MKFAYIVMAENGIPEELSRQIEATGGDVHLLTWRTPVDGAIFFPHSTWTQGRNRLFQAVKDLDYDYFVFMDEDIVLSSDREGVPLAVFEELLEKYRPIVGMPTFPQWEELERHRREGEVSTHYSFDACCVAIRRDALGTLLPYDSSDDAKSWHLSQLYFVHVARVCYPSQMAYFNDLVAMNPVSRMYPRVVSLDKENEVFRATIKEPYQDRFRRAQNYEDTGEYLCGDEGAVCLADYFDMESEYWRACQSVRWSVERGDTDTFNPESVKWDVFHQENGSAATIRELGALPPTPEKWCEDWTYYHVLGDDYHHGRNGKEQDHKKAAEAWLEGAKKGNLQCMKNIAWAYGAGVGVEKNDDAAQEWSQRAAAKEAHDAV
jgi:hypothetical protein